MHDPRSLQLCSLVKRPHQPQQNEKQPEVPSDPHYQADNPCSEIIVNWTSYYFKNIEEGAPEDKDVKQ